MKTKTIFTPTQLKQNSSAIFNAVQKDGFTKIESKSRPDMVLMTTDYLYAVLNKIAEFSNGDMGEPVDAMISHFDVIELLLAEARGEK